MDWLWGAQTFEKAYDDYKEDDAPEFAQAKFDDLKLAARKMKKAGKLELAMEGFERAIKAGAPGDAEEAVVWYNLANTQFEERRYDQAIRSYKNALEKTDPFPQAEYNKAVTICEMANDLAFIKRIGTFLQVKMALGLIDCELSGFNEERKSDKAIMALLEEHSDDPATVVSEVEKLAFMGEIQKSDMSRDDQATYKQVRATKKWPQQLQILTGVDEKLREAAAAGARDDDGTFKLASKYLMEHSLVQAEAVERHLVKYGYAAALLLPNEEGYAHLGKSEESLAVAQDAILKANGNVQVALMTMALPHYNKAVEQYKAAESKSAKAKEMLADAIYNRGVALKDIGEMMGPAGGKYLSEAIAEFASYLERDPTSTNAKRLKECCEWRRGMIVSLTVEQFHASVAAEKAAKAAS